MGGRKRARKGKEKANARATTNANAADKPRRTGKTAGRQPDLTSNATLANAGDTARTNAATYGL